jgi:CRISPR-associated protein Cas1
VSTETELETIPISLVAHTVFCRRRAWLEAMGETVPSLAIEEGTAAHCRIDTRSDDRPMRRRSVDVHHQSLLVTGRCDVIEVGEDAALKIVEYKSSPIRRKATVTNAQRIQLALQGLCLEDMGHEVVGHAVYFVNHRKMVDVEVDQTTIEDALVAVAETKAIVEATTAPTALVDDPRCARCSHAGVCLPDERAEKEVRRRILVSDPDGEVLHLATPGSRVSLKAGRVVVVRGDEDLGTVPVERIQGLVIHGNVDVSSAVIREMLWRSVPIVWCTWRGRVVGHARSSKSPNGLARLQQHVLSAQGDLELARELIGSKVSNQATQLRRSSRFNVLDEVALIRSLARMCKTAGSVNELLGLEGEASNIYFRNFRGMLADGYRDVFADDWQGRVGRGALDRVNVALNYVYGMLLAEVIRGIHASGLDPHAGFVHSSGRNKPALGLDLMEQFRPIIADSVVLNAINNGELKPGMFTEVLGGSRLTDEGRKVLITVYERRMQHTIKHPVFGYQTTWRRAAEVQARMILGVIDGSQSTYVGIRTR